MNKVLMKYLSRLFLVPFILVASPTEMLSQILSLPVGEMTEMEDIFPVRSPEVTVANPLFLRDGVKVMVTPLTSQISPGLPVLLQWEMTAPALGASQLYEEFSFTGGGGRGHIAWEIIKKDGTAKMWGVPYRSYSGRAGPYDPAFLDTDINGKRWYGHMIVPTPWEEGVVQATLFFETLSGFVSCEFTVAPRVSSSIVGDDRKKIFSFESFQNQLVFGDSTLSHFQPTWDARYSSVFSSLEGEKLQAFKQAVIDLDPLALLLLEFYNSHLIIDMRQMTQEIFTVPLGEFLEKTRDFPTEARDYAYGCLYFALQTMAGEVNVPFIGDMRPIKNVNLTLDEYIQAELLMSPIQLRAFFASQNDPISQKINDLFARYPPTILPLWQRILYSPVAWIGGCAIGGLLVGYFYKKHLRCYTQT